uniref:Uncharacterized protein n=1 Tax=Romanomermis culicivorax TaxID=13658 RepID=A0A915IM69_ROMCU
MLEKSVQEADYVQKGLNNEHSVVPGAKPSFMHGLLSASMPDHYYNEALQFASKWKEFLIQVPSSLIFIPPIDPSDSKRIVLDYREFKTISDDYLMASRIGPQIELHLWQHSVEMGGQWTLQTEVIKWCSANIISNLVKEIKSFKPNGNLEVLEAKKKSYFDLLNIRRDLRKYFLFGEFITSLEQKFHINAQNTEAGTRLEAILMDHDETKVLLTFDANGPIVAHQDLQSIVHRRDSDVIGINFGREGELMFTISLNYATRAYAGFDTIFPTKMNRLFNEISFTDNSKIKQLPLLFRIVMDDLLKAIRVDGETGQVSYHEDNTMDMTIRKHQVQVSRVMPRQEQIGTDYRLFSAMDEKHAVGKEELKQKMSWSSVATLALPEIVMAIVNHLTMEKRPEVDDYHCINAFGVNRVNSSSSDATIFLLHNGIDKVIGFQDSPNVIILGDGKKEIKGGQKDDHFVMIGNHAHGFLDGVPVNNVDGVGETEVGIVTIIDDVAVLEKQEANRVILTFIEFYIYKQKYETLVLIFKNRSISLNARLLEHFYRVDISLMWRRMDERLDLVEEEEKEEKELNEYRNTMDKLEHFVFYKLLLD